jgi:hypothetical protein
MKNKIMLMALDIILLPPFIIAASAFPWNTFPHQPKNTKAEPAKD